MERVLLAGAALAILCAVYVGGYLTADGADDGYKQAVLAYDQGDYDGAGRLWGALARQGHARAQFQLGMLHEHGTGLPQDNATAVSWYRKAAEAGLPEAQLRLGLQYYWGTGVARSRPDAMQWFLRAAEPGLTRAQYRIGEMYYDGYGGPPLQLEQQEEQWREAVKWLHLAAEKGDPDAQFRLGSMYDRGLGVEGDVAEAVKWYRQAADEEHYEAQYFLARTYETDDGAGSTGGPDDPMIAWHVRAAGHGYYWSVHMLCDLREKGRVAPVLFDRVIARYRERVLRQQPPYRDNLSWLYGYRDCVAKDDVETVAWYRRSAIAGDAEAQAKLAERYLDGHGVEADETAAVGWLRAAAESGDAFAKFQLGYMFGNGNGVVRDLPQSYRWFALAAIDMSDHSDRGQDVLGRAASANLALGHLAFVASLMTAEQRRHAEALVRTSDIERLPSPTYQPGSRQTPNLPPLARAEPIPFGRWALDRLVSQGKLRHATQADIEAWRNGGRNTLNRLPAGSGLLEVGRTYVVLGKVTLPRGLIGSATVNFIVPSKASVPKGEGGRNRFFSMADHRCEPDCR